MTGERYVRTRRGAMVHKADCSSLGPFPTPWNWADDKAVDQIIYESKKVGITHRWCRHCLPWGNAS